MSRESRESRESRRRNNKIEPLQRGYGCPCGKTYLSYPALFTHIKQKHEGKVGKYLLRLQEILQNLKVSKLEEEGQGQVRL